MVNVRSISIQAHLLAAIHGLAAGRARSLNAIRQVKVCLRQVMNGWKNSLSFGKHCSIIVTQLTEKRDMKRMNGAEGPGPLHIKARRELLGKLLSLQESVGVTLISPARIINDTANVACGARS